MGIGTVNQLDQIQQPPSPGKDSGAGKGFGQQGQNGVITNTATSAQPSMGSPNQYSQTIGLGDNQQQPQSPTPQAGKGKGV